MTIGLAGKKLGMTRIFTEDGSSIPVTMLELLPNRITQIKTIENDGYNAIQVTTGTRKANKLSKAEAGHFAKAGVEPGNQLCEVRFEDVKTIDGMLVGAEMKVNLFTEGQFVDVSGITKGKG